MSWLIFLSDLVAYIHHESILNSHAAGKLKLVLTASYSKQAVFTRKTNLGSK